MEVRDEVAANKTPEKRKEGGSGLGANFGAYPKALARFEDVIADPELFKETLMKLHAEMGTKFISMLLQESIKTKVCTPQDHVYAVRNLEKKPSVVPIIGGKGLDLHQLFVQVTSRGGFEKVIAERKWRDVTATFNFPSTATNASFILRKYYLSLLHHYEQIYLFGSQVWNPAHATSNAPGAASVSSRRSIEPLKINPEALAAPQRRRRISGLASPTYPQVVGVIDGKFENGYLVTVNVGSEKLKGVLYHIPEQIAEPTDDSNLKSPRQRRKRRSTLDPNHPKQNRSGYNFFFAEQHAKLKSLHQGKDGEISRAIGVRWNGLTETEKAVYQERGMKDKERYINEMAVYNENIRLGQHVSTPLPIRQLPAKPNMEESDPKLEKIGDDMNATDEDCSSSCDIDSDGGSSHEDSEIERSAVVARTVTGTVTGSTSLADPSSSKEVDGFELRRIENENL